MPDEPQSTSQASPRRLFVVALFAALLGLVIALSFGYAEHDPKPRGVRIAVSAPTTVTRALDAGLEKAAPGGFQLVVEPNAALTVASVRSQSTAGGFIIAATGPATIVTAAATGLTQQQAITAALSASAKAIHRQPHLVDVAPLSSGDPAGLSTFVFTLALLIPSVIGSIGLFILGMRFRLWWRVAAAILFALLAAAAATLAMDTIFGALTGAGPELIGIGFLGALSFVLFVAAVQAIVGLPGTALAALAFIFVGNAISGGSVPIDFLPGGFRQIAPWLPNAAIVRGVRDVVYFDGHDLGHPLLVLGLWPVVSLMLLAGVDLLHLGARRRAPHSAPEIYATPGIVHIRRLTSRRGSADGAQPSPTDALDPVAAPTAVSAPMYHASGDESA